MGFLGSLGVLGGQLVGGGGAPDDDQDALAKAAAQMPAPPPPPAPPPSALSALAQIAPTTFTPDAPPPLAPAATPALPTKFKGPGGAPTRQDVLTAAQGGTANEMAGIDQAAQVQGSKATYIADQKLKALQDQSDAAQLITQAREQIRQQSQAKIDKVNSAIDDLAKEKPDPNKYWHDHSTASNILTLIGVGLGGASAAQNGGRNVAMDLLQQNIDRSVQAQTRDYSQRLQTLQEKRGTAKDELASNLDALEFKVARNVDANNRVGQMIDAAAARWADRPEIQARAQQMKGALQTKNAELLDSIRGKAVSEAQEGARIGLQQQSLNLDKQRFDEQKNQFDITTLREIEQAKQQGDLKRAEQLEKEQAKAVFSIQDPTTGRAVAAPRPEVATELNKKIGAADEAYNAVDKIFELRGTMGKDEPILGGPNERRISEEMGNLKTAISKLTEQGVITTGDAKRLEQELGNPTGFRNPDQLRQLQGTIVDKVNASVRNETGSKSATWRSNADPNYAQTVRPPGWKPGAVPLGQAPSWRSYQSPEGFQQQRAAEHQMLMDQMNGRGPQPRAPVNVNPIPRYDPSDPDNKPQDPNDILARLAGSLYGG